MPKSASPSLAEPLTAPGEAPSVRRRWLDLLLVIVLAAVAFSPVLKTPLSPFDDYDMLLKNPRYSPPTFSTFKQHFTTPAFRVYTPLTSAIWHPIAYFSFTPPVGQAPQGSMAAIGFKIASVSVHVLAAAAAWWVMTLLVRNRAAAVVGALVFAMHPVQVESVAWTTGLKDELCGLFCLLTIGAYLQFLRDPKSKWRIVTVAMAVLACASKPTAMVLPVLLLAVDVFERTVPLKRRLRDLWPVMVPAAVIAAVMMTVQANPDIPDVPLWKRPLVAGDALAFYLEKIVLPTGLAPDYARSPTEAERAGLIWWTGIIPIIGLILLAMARKRKLWLAGALFLVPLLPLLGLVPFDMQQYSTVTDHYLYLPMIGVGLAVATFIESIPVARSRLAVVGSAVVVGVLLVLTIRQAMLWQDMRALFVHTSKVAPRSYLAPGMLSILAMERDDLLTAEAMARKSLAIKETPTAHDTLSYIAMRQDRRTEAAAHGRRSLAIGGRELERVKKIMRLAAVINDVELAEQAAAQWVKLEPSPTPIEWLAVIRAKHKSAAATQPATAPLQPQR